MDSGKLYVTKARKLKRNPTLFEETQWGASPEPQLAVLRQCTGDSLGDVGADGQPTGKPAIMPLCEEPHEIPKTK